MKKEHLFLGIVVILTLVAASPFLIGTADSITGAGTKEVEIKNTPFPVDAWGYIGWGDCSTQHRRWAGADAYCKCEGYDGALPANEKPCYHESKSPRYKWDTSICPLEKGDNTRSGTAFTKVKCYTETEEPTCTDSDNGKNYYIKGVAIEDGVSWEDSCWDGESPVSNYPVYESPYLYERYCPDPGLARSEAIYKCLYGCKDGACIEEVGYACTDNDGGKNYYKKGVAKQYYNGELRLQRRDICHRDRTVIEYGCINGRVTQLDGYACPSGVCKDGACVKEEKCTDCDIRASQYEGVLETYTIDGVNYNVEATYVGETTCKLKVNSEATKELAEGETDTVAGVRVCIEEVIENEAGETSAGRDVVEFCLKKQETAESHCYDSDGGLDYYTKGNATAKWNGHTTIQPDQCKDNVVGANLLEAFCDEGGIPKRIPYMCPSGCDDGACIRERIHITKGVADVQEPYITKRENRDLFVVFNGAYIDQKRGIYSSVSLDNGQTWSEPRWAVGSWDDSSIIEDNNGDLILLAIKFGEGIGIWRSSDGLIWENLGKVSPTTLDNEAGSIIQSSDGYYYVTYSDYSPGESDIFVARSSDFVNWEATARISSTPDFDFDSSILQTSETGEFFIVYNSYANHKIMFVSSKDGVSWTTPQLAVENVYTHAHMGLNIIELNNRPYLFYGKSYDIYYSYFDGSEWSQPEKIYENALFGADAVALDNENIGIVFVDEMNGQRDVFFDTIKVPE